MLEIYSTSSFKQKPDTRRKEKAAQAQIYFQFLRKTLKSPHNYCTKLGSQTSRPKDNSDRLQKRQLGPYMYGLSGFLHIDNVKY